MARRKAKQKSKYLGRGSFGKGNVKNKRGAGNRGGKGNAGLHKHRYTWTVKYAPDHFGRYGFAPLNRFKMPVMHLYDIQQRIAKGTLGKSGSAYAVEFNGKILSTGNLTHAVNIKALAWSKRCEEKVKQAGGKLEQLEPKNENPGK